MLANNLRAWRDEGVPMSSRVLSRVFSLDDFQSEAKRFLPGPVYEYVAGGSEDLVTLAENRAAFQRYALVPRVMRDVADRHLETRLLDGVWKAPFGISPMGLSALSGYRGDLGLARAAKAAGIPMIVSGTSTIRLEEVRAENADAWFQAYVPGDIERTVPLLERARSAGFQTLVLTVDTFVGASKANQARAGFSTPLRPGARLAWAGLTHPRWLVSVFLRTLLAHGMPHFENSFATRGAPIVSARAQRDHAPKDHLDWSRVAAIRRQWPGRFIVKGVLHPADCIAARDVGADGIIVSNHGGRQLDGSPSPMRMLPEILDRLGRSGARIPVMLDSGFRRGTDVLKALALGADFVFVGRPFNFACSVAGEAGVTHAIDLLKQEVRRGLGMLGYRSVPEVADAFRDGTMIDLTGNAAGPDRVGKRSASSPTRVEEFPCPASTG
jgi:L-lactate dehydrogenase (cytochrome)